jgi:hypothetical protein
VLFRGVKDVLKRVSQECTPDLVTTSPGSTPTLQHKRLPGMKLRETGKFGRRDGLRCQNALCESRRDIFVVCSIPTLLSPVFKL